MKNNINTITINGVTYVEQGTEVNSPSENLEGMPYVIIRSQNAGVFAGYLKSRSGDTVELINSRRLWYWSGAASLSQLSQEGTKKPSECKFPCEVPEQTVLQVIEILKTTKKAQKSIQRIAVWSA